GRADIRRPLGRLLRDRELARGPVGCAVRRCLCRQVDRCLVKLWLGLGADRSYRTPVSDLALAGGMRARSAVRLGSRLILLVGAPGRGSIIRGAARLGMNRCVVAIVAGVARLDAVESGCALP